MRRPAERSSTTPIAPSSRSPSIARWRTCETSWPRATPRWSTTASGSLPSGSRSRNSWIGSSSESRLRLYKGNVIVDGRRSDDSLYDEATVTFEEDDVYDQGDATGFIRLQSLRLRTFAEKRIGEGE